MKMISMWIFIFLCLNFCMATSYAVTHEWTQQIGTSSSDTSRDVSADGLGNVYISGSTSGDLGGANAGSSDAFVSKYDDMGNLLWTQQLGSTSADESLGVSADGLGNVYISGYSQGDLGDPNAGSRDAFVSKYDALGNLLWIEQLGSTSSDTSLGVSADGLGNVYISGFTTGDLGGPNAGSLDAFVSKYDDMGNLLWTQQYGTTGFDQSNGVSADGLGNVYITGVESFELTVPAFVGGGAFVSKYDEGGNLLWKQQLLYSGFGESYEEISGVSADGLGNVYISGYTVDAADENLLQDDFVSKYDDGGNLLWIQRLGSTFWGGISSVSADGLGNVYISGGDGGRGGGFPENAIVSKYDDGGNLLWNKQLESTSSDSSNGVSADGLGNVYISGVIRGYFGGSDDIFIAKFSETIPEPSTFVMGMLAAVGITMRRRV